MHEPIPPSGSDPVGPAGELLAVVVVDALWGVACWWVPLGTAGSDVVLEVAATARAGEDRATVWLCEATAVRTREAASMRASAAAIGLVSPLRDWPGDIPSEGSEAWSDRGDRRAKRDTEGRWHRGAVCTRRRSAGSASGAASSQAGKREDGHRDTERDSDRRCCPAAELVL